MEKVDTIVIQPSKGWIKLNLLEVWKHKDLLYILIWRNIKVRYKQTVLGIAWVIFSPLFNMMVYTIFFGIIAKIPSDNVPYPVFVYTGLIFWNYFSGAIIAASNSLIEGQGIITKVYFPRLILPLATTVTPLIDFVLVYLILLGIMAYYHLWPAWQGILMTPLLLLITFVCATGIGLIAASINVKYRDITYIVPVAIQAMFFATPIIFPISIIPEHLRWLIYFNPMAGIISTFRNSFFHTSDINWLLLAVSSAICILFLFLGIIYFRKTEQFFADEL